MELKAISVNNFFRRAQRNIFGFSLISILALGAICSALIAATSVSALAVYRQVNSVKNDCGLENSAISATNFVLSKLNSSDRAAWDCTSTGGPTPYNLLTLAANEPWVKSANLSKLEVRVSLTGSKGSPSSMAGKPIGAIAAPDQYWRVLTVDARNATSKRLLEVILCPQFTDLRPTQQEGNEGNGNNMTPLFPSAVAATNNILLGAGTEVHKLGGSGDKNDVGAPISAISNAVILSDFIGGNVKLVGNPNPSGANATATIASSTIINQAVYNNPSLNISNGSSSYNTNTGNSSPNVKQQPLPGQPPPPYAFNSLSSNDIPNYTPAASLTSGNNVTSLSDSANFLTKSTVQLSTGDYSSGAMTVPANKTLTVHGDDAPVRIFLQDSSAAPAVVDIQGNINPGGQSQQFQIFYNGTGTIQIRNPNSSYSKVNASIYAPNATVLIGSGQTGEPQGGVNFSGAIVAHDIGGYIDSSNKLQPATKVKFQFDTDMSNVNSESNIKFGLVRQSTKNSNSWNSEKLTVAKVLNMN